MTAVIYDLADYRLRKQLAAYDARLEAVEATIDLRKFFYDICDEDEAQARPIKWLD